LIEVTYTSVAAALLTSEEVFKIIEKSARNNLRDDLSGFLIFSGNRFFQLVEGPEQAIDALLQRLGNDPRHREIRIVSRKPVAHRSFAKWKMKRIVPSADWQVVANAGPEFANTSPSVKAAVSDFLQSPVAASAAQ
jgi:hypothetical protein